MDIALENLNFCNCILSDSLAVLRSLEQPTANIKTNPLILEIKKKKYVEFMKKKTETGQIHLYWIPSEIIENEITETAAKNPCNNVISEPNCIVYHMDLFKPYKTMMISDTNKALIETGKTKGTKYFELYYKDQTKPWFHYKNLPRELIVTINRCRSDHYSY